LTPPSEPDVVVINLDAETPPVEGLYTVETNQVSREKYVTANGPEEQVL